MLLLAAEYTLILFTEFLTLTSISIEELGRCHFMNFSAFLYRAANYFA